MVPKIHAKGSSFKGAAAYLLHDKGRADTNARVAWSEARNLVSDDPDMGWRIMAATAMDQDRLKAQAGVKKTGRKSDKHVLHISLAWHPDQSPSRADMVEAADQAIEAIGAGGRQALIIAHNDERHPHVHLLINRVSPQDGRHLSSSNDRLKLSKWAEAYEKAGGEILCENRVINNAMREQGHYVKGARDIARHIFEQMPAAANDNDRALGVIGRQRAKDHALSQSGRDQAKRHADERHRLAEDHAAEKTRLARQLASDLGKSKAQIIENFRPQWAALYRDQARDRQTFEELERSFFGRASNIVRTVRLSASDIWTQRGGVIARSFRILTNAGERQAYFQAAQERAQRALERLQGEATAKAAKPIRGSHKSAVQAAQAKFLQDRLALSQAHHKDRAEIRAGWKARNAERALIFRGVKNHLRKGEALGHRFAAQSKPVASDRDAIVARASHQSDFKKAARGKTKEQDNARNKDREQ